MQIKADTMKAEIKIDRLKVFARHGVLPQERVVGNDFEVTVSVIADLCEEQIENDQLSATVNYADLVEEVRLEMAVPSLLIEHVAWRIVRSIVDRHAEVESCRVTVAKLLPPIPSAQMKSASVTIAFP